MLNIVEGGEYLCLAIAHAYAVLIVRSRFAVNGASSPTILFENHLATTEANHLAAGKLVAKMLGINKVGKPAKLIDGMSFGSYLKKIENPRTISDWLTKDEKVVDWYRNEPWCTFHFTPNAYYHMFSGMQKAHDIERMKKLPKGLPILITSGAEDPVGAWGEGVRKTFMVYSDNTECEVSIRMYDDDRHEILNETDKEQVYADMLEFLDSCLEK